MRRGKSRPLIEKGGFPMKKLICSVAAIALCMMTMGALAEEVPSRTTDDLTHFTVTAENQPNDETLFLRPVQEEETETYQERLDVCKTEVEKMVASESPETYYGNIKNMTDMSGDMVTLKDLIGDREPTISEFCPVVAGGFHEDSGTVTANMTFPTPYEEGERVIVMIGIVTVNPDGTQTVEYRAFEGIGLGADGGIQVQFDQETIQAIQNNMAVMSVVSF